jgi:hypothetical protein
MRGQKRGLSFHAIVDFRSQLSMFRIPRWIAFGLLLLMPIHGAWREDVMPKADPHDRTIGENTKYPLLFFWQFHYLSQPLPS